MIEAFPLHWAAGYKRTAHRIHSRFKQTMGQALNCLRDEVKRLGGTNLIISTNIPVKNDGGLYAAWLSKTIEDPGVAVYFKYKGKDIAMCCDQYKGVWENMYAIGQSIAALRSMERWGCSDFLERAFTGFTALPEAIITPVPKTWWDVLGVSSTASEQEIKTAYREKAKIHHPDNGGNPEEFHKIVEAYLYALKQFEKV